MRTANSLSISVAASRLGLSPNSIRRLCDSGKLASFRTAGGHLRLPAEAIESYRKGNGASDASASAPSSALRNRKEQLEGLRLDVEEVGVKRQLKRLREEAAEEEAERADAAEAERQARAEERRQARQEEEERIRQAEEKQRKEDASRQRRAWTSDWVQWILKRVPSGAPPDAVLSLRESAEEILGKTSVRESREVIEPVLLAARDRALQPWIRRKNVEAAIEKARHEISGFAALGTWGDRAIVAATEAVQPLPVDAPISVVRAAATEAGKKVAAECRQAEAAAQHQRDSENTVGWVSLPGATDEQLQAAQRAVRESVEKLPVGCGSGAIRAAREKALIPFQRQIEAVRQANWALNVLSFVGDSLKQLQADGDWFFESDAERYELEKKMRKKLAPELAQEFLTGSLDPEDRNEVRAWIEDEVENYLEKNFASGQGRFP